MFTKSTVLFFSALTATHAALVQPNEPGPGSVFNEGTTCHIAWGVDASAGTGNWKDMTITLRTGSNLAMTTITQVATGQDGSVPGTFDYPCPDVTPQSAIYFYEFNAPGATADGPQWTTRFAIADAQGNTVPPENADQPNPKAGDPAIPWGTGKLESGTASGVSGSSSAAASASSGAPGASNSTASATSAAGSSTSSGLVKNTSGSASSSSASKTGAAGAATTSGNAALPASLPSGGVLSALLGATAMVFTLLL
ncbi:hypothetical protein DL96DRAFT_1627082 [Flagelloscypha sp. PMI_526]|nr:hypothetical protein DL96DRAFT_1627082 [Flagelloscypha sp. PMI_526]